MNTELARDLQYRITKEALAMLVIHGSAAETDDYERAIILIGSAWGLDPQNARVPSGADHAGKGSGAWDRRTGGDPPRLPESELPMNAAAWRRWTTSAACSKPPSSWRAGTTGRPSSGSPPTDGNAESAGLDREDAGGTGAA